MDGNDFIGFGNMPGHDIAGAYVVVSRAKITPMDAPEFIRGWHGWDAAAPKALTII